MKPYIVAGRRVSRDLWVHEVVDGANGQVVPGTTPFSGSPTGAQAAQHLADLLNAAHAAGATSIDLIPTLNEVIK